jgi:hypothetical protein
MRPCLTEIRVMLGGQHVDLRTQRSCTQTLSLRREKERASAGGNELFVKVTLYRQRIQSVTRFMVVLIFTKIAKCSFVTPAKLSFDKL